MVRWEKNNSNESFNNQVAAKCPKSKHYSKSESLDNRIASAVAQKNIGEPYLATVNESGGLSPGKIHIHSAKKLIAKHAKRKLFESGIKHKRRLQLKGTAESKRQDRELREGQTYETGIALTSPSELQTIEIPAKTESPNVESIKAHDSTQIVIFDLETTSLSIECEITQIGRYHYMSIQCS